MTNRPKSTNQNWVLLIRGLAHGLISSIFSALFAVFATRVHFLHDFLPLYSHISPSLGAFCNQPLPKYCLVTSLFTGLSSLASAFQFVFSVCALKGGEEEQNSLCSFGVFIWGNVIVWSTNNTDCAAGLYTFCKIMLIITYCICPAIFLLFCIVIGCIGVIAALAGRLTSSSLNKEDHRFSSEDSTEVIE